MAVEKEILVVDDEELMRDLFEQIFSGSGFTVYCATCAEEALDILAKKQFPIMIFDLKLPGMTGIELCKKIRKDMPTTFIVAVTGFNSLFDLIECREAGFDDYLPKPLSVPLLIKLANDAIERLTRWKKR